MRKRKPFIAAKEHENLFVPLRDCCLETARLQQQQHALMQAVMASNQTIAQAVF